MFSNRAIANILMAVFTTVFVLAMFSVKPWVIGIAAGTAGTALLIASIGGE
jgi:hypothetical protein